MHQLWAFFSVITLVAAGSWSPPSTEECPDEVGDWVVGVPFFPRLRLQPNQYVICYRGLPLIFNCSNGLVFNQQTLTCDYPSIRRSHPPMTRPNPDILDPRPVLPPLPETPVVLPLPLPAKPFQHRPDLPPLPPMTRPNPEFLIPRPVLPHPVPVPVDGLLY